MKLEEMLEGMEEILNHDEGLPEYDVAKLGNILARMLGPMDKVDGPPFYAGVYVVLEMVEMFGVPDDLDDYRPRVKHETS